jgi:hypothetical protein
VIVTIDHAPQRKRARRRAMVVVVVPLVLSFGASVDHAAAQTAVTEPEVQIGEARAIERPAPAAAAAGVPSHDAAGVAVAGIAIARSAPPVAAKLPSDPTASNAAALAVGGLGAVALLGGLWQLLRRRRYDLLA